MNKDNDFFELNLKNKVSYLQEEHILVLKTIYDDACEKGAIKDYRFVESRSHSMKYTKIREKIQNRISDEVLYICLTDLERLGFIIYTMLNPFKESEYGIFFVGIEYFKNIKDKNFDC